MKLIESMDQWSALSAELSKRGYYLWQMQYDIHHPEGFHARFARAGRPDVEIVTRDEKVCSAIVRYNGEQRMKKAAEEQPPTQK